MLKVAHKEWVVQGRRDADRGNSFGKSEIMWTGKIRGKSKVTPEFCRNRWK